MIPFFKDFCLQCLFLVLFFCVFSVAMACEVTDDAGKTIHLAGPAQRIISLAPDLTELLFVSGAGKKIVGVMKGSDFPLAARQIPVVASYNSLNEEAILALHPDLIVMWAGNGVTAETRLSRLGIPLFLSHQRDLTDIPKTMQKFGCLAGTTEIADRAALHFSNQLHQLVVRYQQKKSIRVFYEVAARPLMTINEESWINQVISLCGGKNIFANIKVIAPVISQEAVILANPDVIMGREVSEWRAWPMLRAVQKKNLFAVNPDLLERASPRLLLGAESVCRELDVARAR